MRLSHVAKHLQEHVSDSSRIRILKDFELVLQVEGSSWIYSQKSGGSLEIPAGCVAFIPHNYPHAWGADAGSHIALHFDFHANPRIQAMKNFRYTEQKVSRAPLRFVPQFELTWPNPQHPILIPLVTRIHNLDLWKQRLLPLTELWIRRTHHTLSAQLLFQETLCWALRTLSEDAASSGIKTSDETDLALLALLQTLENTPHERPSIDELAARVHMGLTAFRAAFFKATGRPPRQYLEERHIERAARAIVETNRKLYEIAHSEGYDDPYHFSRIFKRVMGVSPRVYRQSR
jgi:AraC-like DNA-binding protein